MKNYLESDKLLAEFLGATVTQPYPENIQYPEMGISYHFDFSSCPKEYKPPGIDRFYTSVSVKFSTSLDWLRPVWKLLLLILIEDPYHDLYYKTSELLRDALLNKSYENVYNVLVESIENYLRNKK